MKYELIFVMSDRYITSSQNPLIKLSTSSKSTKSKDILPRNILQLITKIVPISRKKMHKLCIEKRHPLPSGAWRKISGNKDNSRVRISQMRETVCRANTSVNRKKYFRVTVRNPSRKINHLSKVVWDWKIITEFARSISSTKIG